MLLQEALALQEEAAKDTRARLGRDIERASPRLRPLLLYLRDHLFDPDLDITRLRRACKARDHSLSTLFGVELGQPPKRYLAERRLETAAELLMTTELSAAMIGGLVGYPEPGTFRRAFKSWSGLPPGAYRRRVPLSERAPESLVPWGEAAEWWRAMNGALAPGEASDFLRHLLATYPPPDDETNSATSTEPVKLVFDGRDFERFMAEQVWKQIEHLPVSRQKDCVRHRVAFRTPALFEVLSEKSLVEGRADRQGGIRLAELALESVRGSEDALADSAADYLALAWARLGNAHRLALDFPEADEAFSQVASFEQEQGEPRARGQIYSLKSALRMNQRRFTEAARLARQAVEVARPIGESAFLAKCLIQQATVDLYAGKPEPCVERYREALAFSEGSAERYLQLSAHSGLVSALVLVGDLTQAAELLDRARGLCSEFGNRLFRFQLNWLEGYLLDAGGEAAEAELALMSAKAGFVELREMDHAAVVSLDLASIYLLQERERAAMALIAETLPLFEALSLKSEVLASIKLLRRSLENNQLKIEAIQRVRKLLESCLLAPSGWH